MKSVQIDVFVKQIGCTQRTIEEMQYSHDKNGSCRKHIDDKSVEMVEFDKLSVNTKLFAIQSVSMD
jgi:hypothetical protein